MGGAGSGSDAMGSASKFPIRNLIVGACELTHAVPDASTCTGWDQVYECVGRNCEGLAACAQTCADFLACAAKVSDPCNLAGACPKTVACTQCTLSVEACGQAPCEPLFRCAMPTADLRGACSRLESCCAKQTDPLACMTWHDRAASVLGDPGCQMFIDDPGFLKAYVNDPPCTP